MARSSGRTTRQQSQAASSALSVATSTDVITSTTPDPSMQTAIDSLGTRLGAVGLKDMGAAPAVSSRPPRAAKPRSLVTATAKTTTITTATPSQKLSPLPPPPPPQQQHQEPAIVRRSRRGDRAISHHPQIGRYRVELTSSERLWCGKFALAISTEQQLGMRLAVDEFDDIFGGDESRAFNAGHGWAAVGGGGGVEETAPANFYDEQLDFVLRVWGRRRGLRLQLGVVRDFEGVFVNRGLESGMVGDGEERGECITLWIHNDNAILLGRPFNHYSGMSVLEKAS